MKNNKIILLFFLISSYTSLFGQQKKAGKIDLPMTNQEAWWFGIINHGEKMPLQNGYTANLDGDNYGNQIQPLLLSSEGRFVWSENAFEIKVEKSNLTVLPRGGEIISSKEGAMLREGYLKASKTYFPPSGK